MLEKNEGFKSVSKLVNHLSYQDKETKSSTMNIFDFFKKKFKSFVKVELSYVFTVNLFTIAENCTESELSYKTGLFFSCW